LIENADFLKVRLNLAELRPKFLQLLAILFNFSQHLQAILLENTQKLYAFILDALQVFSFFCHKPLEFFSQQGGLFL
jgi:hypothetical protein